MQKRTFKRKIGTKKLFLISWTEALYKLSWWVFVTGDSLKRKCFFSYWGYHFFWWNSRHGRDPEFKILTPPLMKNIHTVLNLKSPLVKSSTFQKKRQLFKTQIWTLIQTMFTSMFQAITYAFDLSANDLCHLICYLGLSNLEWTHLLCHNGEKKEEKEMFLHLSSVFVQCKWASHWSLEWISVQLLSLPGARLFYAQSSPCVGHFYPPCWKQYFQSIDWPFSHCRRFLSFIKWKLS